MERLMMQKNTKKKFPAILSALIIVIMLLAFLLVFVIALKSEEPENAALWTIIVLYGIPIAAIMIGIIFALRQRIKEIDSGEEENAKQY